MSIARLDPAAPARRPVRLAWSGVLAVLTLALAASPALAVVTPLRAEPGSSGSSRTAVAPAPGLVVAPDASPSPSSDVTASASPSASPSPSASASPDPSASASPSPTPTATPSPAPTPAWSKTVTTVGSSIRFYGRGNGHGVGMSQWGARGRAAAGQTAAQIVSAYFSGATVGSYTSGRLVRVLVLSAFAGSATTPLTIHGRSGPWTVSGTSTTFPADAALTVWRTSAVVNGATVVTWHVHVVAADGSTVLYNGTAASATVTVRPTDTTGRLQLNSKPSSYDTYRGRLVLSLKSTSVSVVNWVGLDDYLKGVVPVEMPASWPAEALKAQVIVARSWTVRHFRSTTTYTYDVYDDSRSQVYRGVKGETSGVNALIAAQPGVLLYGTSVVNAFYCSAAGGWTENNEDAFVGSNGVISSSPLPYLRGRDDRTPNGTAYDAGAPGFSWSTATLTHAQLNAILAADSRTAVGTITKLDLTHRGVSGRLYQVVIYGTAGTKTVSGDVFRAVYNAHRPAGSASMLSNLFDAAPLP